LLDKLIKISKKLKSKFYFDYEIYKLTWFKTGGKADCFCIVDNQLELEIILNEINSEKQIFVLGVGSNILIRDGGYRGIIIKLGKSFNFINLKDQTIAVGSSILDSYFSKFAYLNSISGYEFFSGIPGTIGGAIKMNAGCFENETKDGLSQVFIIDKKGNKKKLANEDLNLSYRYSNLSEGDIVLSAEFKKNLSDKNEIKEKMEKIKNFRKNSQPIESKTGGSTFKNPKKQFAARLIEYSNCKGLNVGDASVSLKHSNFLINNGRASANDIEILGNIVREKVEKKFNILLDWEIKIIGENAKK